MRQNKICCKWQSKEIWRMMTYIRPWVIVKSLGHIASQIICAKTWFVQTSCLLQVVRRDDQFRWRRLASPLWREAESFLISSYALLQTKTAWRIHLQKTGTGEFFLFTFPSSKHFCLLLEFIETRQKKKYKNSKPSLVDYYYHVLLLLLELCFWFSFCSFFVFYVLFLFSFHHPRTTLICTWSLSMFPVVRCFHICEKLDDSGKCLSPQFAINPVWKPVKHVAYRL